MARSDNAYSRVIFWLKIALPLMALVILSTLFLFPRNVGVDGGLPYVGVDVDALVREQRLTAPEYFTVTEDGAAIRVEAAAARPASAEGGARADRMVAAYHTPGGLRIELTAAEGLVDRGAGRMRLSGGVEIVTSSGYRMVTEGLDGALDRTELSSDGEVDAVAPFGTIAAGSMEISRGPAANPDYVLVFKEGVKLVYLPGD